MRLRTSKMIPCICFIIGSAMFGTAYAGTTTYKYDVQGRIIEIDYPNGAIVKYTYDNAGNRSQIAKQAGS